MPLAAYLISTSQPPDRLLAGVAGASTGFSVCLADSTSTIRCATTFSSPGCIIAAVIEMPLSPGSA